MSIIWTVIIGFVAGVIAKLITPGKNEPSGFILTTYLASWVLSLPLIWGKQWAGITKVKGRDLSGQSSER